MGRIQGLAESPVLTGNTLLKTGEGEVHSITVAWKGAAVGDIIAYLLDGVTDVSSNPSKVMLVVIAATANGIWSKEWPQGKRFVDGIYYKEGVADNAYSELTYK